MNKYISGDRIILTSALLNGKGFISNEYMSVYRDHDTGISKVSDGTFVKKNEIKLHKTLNKLTKGKYKKRINKNIFDSYKVILNNYFNNKNYLLWIINLISSLFFIRTKTDIKIFFKEYLFRLT